MDNGNSLILAENNPIFYKITEIELLTKKYSVNSVNIISEIILSTVVTKKTNN